MTSIDSPRILLPARTPERNDGESTDSDVLLRSGRDRRRGSQARALPWVHVGPCAESQPCALRPRLRSAARQATRKPGMLMALWRVASGTGSRFASTPVIAGALGGASLPELATYKEKAEKSGLGQARQRVWKPLASRRDAPGVSMDPTRLPAGASLERLFLSYFRSCTFFSLPPQGEHVTWAGGI